MARIWLEDKGAADILRYNPKLEQMEREIMDRKLSEVKAQFLIDFGVEGNFELRAIQTRPDKNYGRLAYRLHAADKRTGAILKAHPKWLSKFI